MWRSITANKWWFGSTSFGCPPPNCLDKISWWNRFQNLTENKYCSFWYWEKSLRKWKEKKAKKKKRNDRFNVYGRLFSFPKSLLRPLIKLRLRNINSDISMERTKSNKVWLQGLQPNFANRQLFCRLSAIKVVIKFK